MLRPSTCYQFPGNFYQKEGDQFILIIILLRTFTIFQLFDVFDFSLRSKYF